MQVSQYSQWDQRNAAFVPPTRLAPEHQPRDLSPPNSPGMSLPPPAQSLHPDTLGTPQRPGAQNRQSTGFFSAFSRTKSAGSGQILSPPATPSAGQVQPPQQQPQQGLLNPTQPQPYPTTPSPRVRASSLSGVTHSTSETPNPDATVPEQPQSPPLPQQQPPPPPTQRMPEPESPFALGPTGIPLHPEIRSVLRLNSAHQQKVYYSGRLSKRVERGTDGSRPTKDEGWIEIWCQLGGVTLSIWNMKAIEEANARGEQVPPQYVNVTDAFVQVLGSVTFPATANFPAKRFTNVLTLNTAGSNLLLFVCESPAALVSWAAALRLASWEKSRLEEIYTAHLLRITLTESRVWKEPRTTLVKGQLEGWARIRVAGQTDWKRLWVVVSAGSPNYQPGAPDGTQSTLSLTTTRSRGGSSPTQPKKSRLSGLFGRSSHSHTSSTGSANGGNVLTRPNHNGGVGDAPTIVFYTSSKPKERKAPVLSITNVSQAFAVYPERPDLITRSTLVKVEGRLGREEGAGAIKGTEAWVLIMPEVESGQAAGPRKMLEWIVGVHDAFRLYGRPTQYSFNPHNPTSLMFAYPIDPNVDQLFLDRELAESLDPREDATSVTRGRLTTILQERMRRPLARQNNSINGQPQPQPQEQQTESTTTIVSGSGRQPATGGRGPALTPITERSTTGETRTFTARDSTSPATWPEAAAQVGDGSMITQGGILVKSPIEEEDERPISMLWGASGGAAAGHERGGEGHGARPISMALGATNVDGPGSTGANVTESSSAASRGLPAPGLGTTANVQTSPLPTPQPQNLPTGYETNVAPTAPNGHAEARSNMSLGTGVPEPGAVDLRGVEVEHWSSNGNGHMYGAPHPYENGHAQLSGSPHESVDKPVLAPIRTTALSPPRNAMKPSPAQAEKPIEKPASPPAGAQQPIQPADASSGEDFIPSEAARFILGQESTDEGGLGSTNAAGRGPTSGQRKTFESSSEDEGENEMENEPLQRPVVQAWQKDPTPSPIRRQSTPMAFADMGYGSSSNPQEEHVPAPQQQRVYASPERMSAGTPPPVTQPPSTQPLAMSGNPRTVSGMSSAGSRNLGRKPSGARAPPVKTPRVVKTPLAQHPIADDDEHRNDIQPTPPPVPPLPTPPQPQQYDMADDLGADALAALSFAEHDHHSQRAPSPPLPPPHAEDRSRTPSPVYSSAPRPPRQQPSTLAPQQPNQGPAYRSSFAPSKNAAERKAKAQAHQVAAEDAMKRPGRANGSKPKSSLASSRSGAWESSDEEDAQEQEEDASGDDEPLRNRSGPPSVHAQMNVHAPQPQQQHRGMFLGSAPGSATDLHSNTPPGMRPLPSPDAHHQQTHGRAPRGLPALPGSAASQHDLGQGRPSTQMYGGGSGPQSRAASMAYDDRERGHSYGDEQHQQQGASQQPYRGAYRQTIWSNALDPNNRSVSPGQGNKDTFVQINPNETMTKAFTPQGLLQAGLQDKHDRSAKRQEEIAREAGASLLNVPNKPPPPQTGLLGAVTAHERDRKRDGGFGAVLTEREREKRLAEDRQRKIDELQRQQLEHQQSMYGGNGSPMNPMMMNPMMTGMGGMGMMGFNPMMAGMGGFDPQQQYQMWAAQQAAAEAYQRAMMTFSQAGSVAPGQQDEARIASPMPGQWGMMGGMGGMGMGGMGMGMPMMGMNPMMTGSGMGMMGQPGFGGSQFGGMGMGGMMGMPGQSQMGGQSGMGMGGQPGFQGSPGLPRDSEDSPARQSDSPAAGGSGNQR